MVLGLAFVGCSNPVGDDSNQGDPNQGGGNNQGGGPNVTWTISAGTSHAVAVSSTGELWAWGNNANGRTGLGVDTGSTSAPTRVGTATNWASASAGDTHTVAVTTTGELWAWGSNSTGRTSFEPTWENTLTPTRVGTATNWASVSAGDAHTAAVTTNGELWVWGDNWNGRTGLGVDAGNTLIPTRVGTATNWAAVSAGGSHTVAITTTGELWSWGNNSLGRTGLGQTTGNTLEPVRVGSATNWATVFTGSSHTVAVTTTGELWAWGSNTNGRLGDGTITTRNVPTRIGTATNWVRAFAGDSHSVAVTTTGELWVWGNNADSQLGDGTTTQSTSPVRIGTATNWAAVSAGNAFTVAANTVGEFWAWGSDANGRLGTGLELYRTVPTRIRESENWVYVSAGVSHTVAITTGGELWAWGNNANGRLGDGTTIQQTSPIRIGAATNWASVSAGDSHTVAVTTTGELWSWGSNSFGRTGLGSTTGNTLNPTQVGTATNWASVSAGDSHTVAVTMTGELWAWGNNLFGRTGLGESSGSTQIPTQVGVATNWASASAGEWHTVAVTTTGELWAWGNNLNTGIGTITGDTITPIRIGIATNWASVSAGARYTVAVTTTGESWAWGDNTNGQLGDGTTTRRNVPTLIGAARNWAYAFAGDSHTVAVTTTGELWAWGNNVDGRTGLGMDTGNTLAPTRVGTATNWNSVSAGDSHAVATVENGELWVWGSNANGRLGTGLVLHRAEPVRIKP